MVVGRVIPQRAMVAVPPMDAERVMNDGVRTEPGRSCSTRALIVERGS